MLRWKYGHDLVLGQALADHFARCSPLARIWYDVVVPVPIHRTRLQQRGFNQAAILARALARAGGLRLRFVLGRRASRPSQTALGRAERRANTAGVFFLRDAGAICRRRVLLVDDVLTTTATVRGCAEALLSGGAALVDVAALARAADPFARAEPVLQSAANPVLPGTVA